MQCGFCARPIHIVEDYIYHEGLVFHPQGPAENNIHCAPRVRSFDEEPARVLQQVTVTALTLRAASVNGAA
jgi:hypothetical protein